MSSFSDLLGPRLDTRVFVMHLLTAFAVTALLLPAARTSRVDPMTVLRHE